MSAKIKRIYLSFDSDRLQRFVFLIIRDWFGDKYGFVCNEHAITK